MSTATGLRLAGVFAHPDDDVYQIGGTLALHSGKISTTLVFCTSGDAGPITSPELATRENLGDVREREQGAAMARLGVAQTTGARFLRHPDYYLPDVPFEQLVGEIEAVLREMRPHVVVTFGPDGLTSHHDHIRAGAACTEGVPPRAWGELPRRRSVPAALSHGADPRGGRSLLRGHRRAGSPLRRRGRPVQPDRDRRAKRRRLDRHDPGARREARRDPRARHAGVRAGTDPGGASLDPPRSRAVRASLAAEVAGEPVASDLFEGVR